MLRPFLRVPVMRSKELSLLCVKSVEWCMESFKTSCNTQEKKMYYEYEEKNE